MLTMAVGCAARRSGKGAKDYGGSVAIRSRSEAKIDGGLTGERRVGRDREAMHLLY